LHRTITALLGPGDQRHHHLLEAIRLPLAISDHCCDESVVAGLDGLDPQRADADAQPGALVELGWTVDSEAVVLDAYRARDTETTARAELRALSCRMSIHSLEYSLTNFPALRESAVEYFPSFW
jgi:hypothetical protein